MSQKKLMLTEWLKRNHAAQPSVGAELKAVFRGGREDAWSALIPAFPGQSVTREPGSPTPQQTTDALRGVGEHDQSRSRE